MKKLLTLFLLLNGFFAFAQGEFVAIEDVNRYDFRRLIPIMKNANEASGYVCYTVDSKGARGMRYFNFNVFDANLKIVKSTKIEFTKNMQLLNSAYDGEHYFIVFYDNFRRILQYVTFDNTGEIVANQEITDDFLRNSFDTEVYAGQDGDFYIIRTIKEKRVGYQIQKMDEKLNVKWTQRFTPEKGYIGVESIVAGKGCVALVQVQAPKIISAKRMGKVVCLNDSDGSTKFTYELFDQESTAMPCTFLIEEDGSLVTGGMYFKGLAWDAVNSDGVFILKLDAAGKKVFYNKTDWNEGIQKFLRTTTTGFKVGSQTKLFFEDIVKLPDGSYQIISESFRKSIQLVSSVTLDLISGKWIGYIGGSATAASNSSDKPVSFNVMDIIILNYDNTGKLTNLANVPKKDNRISCYYPYSGMGGLALANVVKSYGYFNYEFTVQSNGDQLMVSKNMSEKDNVISITKLEKDKVLTTKDINTKLAFKDTKIAAMGCLPNVAGKMVVYYYDKRNDSVILYLEEVKM